MSMKEMNGEERFIAAMWNGEERFISALRCEEVDRMPSCWFVLKKRVYFTKN